MKNLFQIVAQILIIFVLLFSFYFVVTKSIWFRAMKSEYIAKKKSDEAQKDIILHVLPNGMQKPIFLLHDEQIGFEMPKNGDTTLIFYDNSCIKKSSTALDYRLIVYTDDYKQGYKTVFAIKEQKYCFSNSMNTIKGVSIIERMPCMCDDHYKRTMTIMTICDSLTSQILAKRDSFVNDYCLKTKK